MSLPYWILAIALLCSVTARFFLIRTFKKLAKNTFHYCPKIEVAVSEVLHQNDMKDVTIERADGMAYADTYFPRSRMVMINKKTADSRDAVSMCTALQAAGRAIVMEKSKLVYLLKYVLYPILRFTTMISIPLAILSLLLHNVILFYLGMWCINAYFLLSLFISIIEVYVSGFGIRYLKAFVPKEEKMARAIFAAIDLTYCSMTLAGMTAPFRPLINLFLRKTMPRGGAESRLI